MGFSSGGEYLRENFAGVEVISIVYLQPYEMIGLSTFSSSFFSSADRKEEVPGVLNFKTNIFVKKLSFSLPLMNICDDKSAIRASQLDEFRERLATS